MGSRCIKGESEKARWADKHDLKAMGSESFPRQKSARRSGAVNLMSEKISEFEDSTA
jgi:hypothetical protein